LADHTFLENSRTCRDFMPAKKNSKERARSTGDQAETGQRRRKPARAKQARLTVEDRSRSRNSSGRSRREQDIHEDLALTFLTEYQSFEQALVRAGYTRAGRLPGSTQVDWERFARHIERYFKPDTSAELQGAVAYLLYEGSNLEHRQERLQNPLPWEIVSPRSDLVWLSELVQQTRNQVILGLSLPESPGCRTALVMAALLVVEGMAYTDPDIESLLTSAI
jgi:hypothetical protein